MATAEQRAQHEHRRSVACPTCLAHVGMPCADRWGYAVSREHSARVAALLAKDPLDRLRDAVGEAIAAYDRATPELTHPKDPDRPCDCQRCMISELIGYDR